ncbi:hypothetical protein E2320_014621 [Naja naja]|nr:hypothetical protein E2320_014621 [Naja naja]
MNKTMDKRKESNKHLDPPAVFQTTRPTGFRELIPPSHFQSQSAPPPTVSTTGLLGATAYPNWEETAELRRENLRLKDELQRWNTKVDATEDPKDKTRLAEPSSVTLAMSQQAEIIAHQLHEIQRLESEVSALRVSSAQQEATIAARESTLSNLRGELTFLKSQNLTEVAILKTQLEEVRKSSQQEKEALRNELEELRKQSQLKTDFLREELESTKERSNHEVTLAQGELQQMREEREVERRRQEAMRQICTFQQDLEAQRKEASQLREKKDTLQNQLSVTEAELASQNALVLQFKTYVGEQKSNQPGFEQDRLINRIQVHLQDPLQSESSQKLQGLLTRWREKVFSLLVQLKSQELSHRDDTKHLEKKTLQAEMMRSNEQMHGFQQRAEAGEKALRELADFQQLMGQEERWKAALLRLLGLGNRVSFATKRVDTIQGLVCRKIALAKLQREEKHVAGTDQEIQPSYEDLQAELHMLHEERDRLSTELKHGAQLIEKKTDLSKMRGTLQHLQETLEAKTAEEQELRQQLEATEKQLETTNSELQRTAGAADSLRHEVGQLRGEYERALQEKVSEVETQLRKDLLEMEKALNTARREHAKAVVALRQAERQAARDKARSEELTTIQESATQQEMARLEGRLKELERDKNVLMATLRQEGLLAEYRQNRLLAVPAKSVGKTGTSPPSKESLFAVLDDLQTLGAAILEEEECDKNTNVSMDI